MKQKLLTLFTLLLTVCSGAWGQNFSAICTASEDANLAKNTTNQAITASQATITGGTMSASNTDSSEKQFLESSQGEDGNKKACFCISASKISFKITLTKALQAGDKIDFIVYTASNKTTTMGLKLNGDITMEGTADPHAWVAPTTYTVVENDGLCGETEITLTRSRGYGCYFTDFTITRASSDPSISASNVNIAATATGGSIAYMVNNPVAGGAVTAAEKGTSGWLTSVGTETTSPISFTAEENTGAERSATVTLTYTYNTSETVEKDVTITQAAKTYAITYNHGVSGTGEIAAGQKKHGVDFTLSSETFTRAGYEQTGWATSDGGDKVYELGGSYTANADIELFPVWEEAKYTVIYNVNGGGSCATESATQPTVGAALTLPTPTWDGYTFDGWYNDGSYIGDAGATYTPTANITLYAKWTDNIEGKLFSYVDGNYGDKFQAYDGSGWVTEDTNNKSKTFTDGTTGVQYIINKGNWDKKNNSISALAKFKNGTTGMSIVIPTGYQATVKILYGAYGTSDEYKMTVNETAQASPNAKFGDGHTNAQIASDMKDITLYNQSGTLTLGVNGEKNIYIGRVAVTLTHVSATISNAGYATFSSTKKLDFTDVEGLTAYKATAASENSVTLEDVTGIVPANEGLLLKGAANTYYIPVSTADPTADVDGNLLQSTATAEYTVTGSEKGTAYVFGSLNEVVGFYKAATGKTIGVGKSWLLVPGTGGAKDVEFLSFVFGDEEQGETDGIKAVSTKVENGVRYNLAGQKVGADYKGIVIVNGKKVIIK